MPVTKRMMAAGDWSIQLDPRTPYETLSSIGVTNNGFAVLYVTDSWFDPTNLSAATIQQQSIYTGLYRKQEGYRLTTLSGCHISGLLGDEDGKGDLQEGTITYTSTTGQPQTWVAACCPSWASVSSLQVSYGTSNGLAWTWHWGGDSPSPRLALDYLATAFQGLKSTSTPFAWMLYDDLTLLLNPTHNIGRVGFVCLTDDNTFESGNWAGGLPSSMVVLPATIANSIDVEQYVNRGIGDWGGGGGSAFSYNAASPTNYKDPAGSNLSWKIKAEFPDATDGSQASASMANLVDPNSGANYLPTITVDHFGIMASAPNYEADYDKLAPGDTVNVWSPDNNISDVTNPVYLRGQLVYPEQYTIQSITMPIEAGMGVYMQRSFDSAIVDITRYVQWEPPGAQIEVGGLRPLLTHTFKPRSSVVT